MTAARARLDAELVRRGLARSREQAGELVAAGRVTVAGQRAAKAATQVTRDAPISVADTGRAGVRLARRAQAGRGAGGVRPGGLTRGGPAPAWTRARPPAGSPTCCCGPAPRTWWRPTSATGSWPGRCAPTRGSPCWTGSTCGPWPEQVAPVPGLVVADLSFISLTLVLPALVGVRRAGRRLRAAGQAPVRGGQGPGRRGRRGARRRSLRGRGRRGGRAAAGSSAWACWGSPPARCPGPPGTWSTSSGCAGARRRSTTAELGRAIAEGPS